MLLARVLPGSRRLAQSILGVGTQSYANAFSRAVANNTTCQAQATFNGDTLLSSAGITDANILFVVAQQWDVIAGVIPSQIP